MIGVVTESDLRDLMCLTEDTASQNVITETTDL